MANLNTHTTFNINTKDAFIKHEIAVWGEDYIFTLMDNGYEIVSTDRGWRWVAPVDPNASYGGNTRFLASVR